MIRALALTAVLTLASTLAGCDESPESIGLKSGAVVTNPVAGRPSAGYFTLVNGPKDLVLEYARVPLAVRTEMHETLDEGGRMIMKPIDRVRIPANSTLEFKPGGKHLMVFDLDPTATRIGRAVIQLRFSDGSQIEYNAPVSTMGQSN